jgi:hypothetical protein
VINSTALVMPFVDFFGRILFSSLVISVSIFISESFMLV